MTELPLKYKKAIDKYEPINAEGLTLYPILVEEYYEFLVARRALDFMQQSLPIELMSVPILDAFFRLDSGRVQGNEKPTGLFMSVLLALSLALRLFGKSIEERVSQFRIVLNPQDPSRIKHLRYTKDGEEIVTITPIQFQRLRPIIAAQNGVEIVDENANPELIQAERDLAEKKVPKLDISIRSMVSAASVLMNVKEEEVYQWEILRLNDRLAVKKRELDYLACAIGESQGTRWNGGNPVPHPWFERMKEGNNALISLDKFAAGQGMAAIKNALGSNNTT